MIYILTLKDKTLAKCPLSVLDRFNTKGHNFKTRLKQFQQLFPQAGIVDWIMDEGNPNIPVLQTTTRS